MKKLLFLLALALLASAAPLAKAKDEAPSAHQPVVVAAFSGYAELKRDLGYLGTLSGNPDMAKGLEQLLMLFTQNQGLAGLDQSRPWGAALSIGDNGDYPAMVFLPVDDLQKLLDALAAVVGESVDAGDEIFEIKRNANTFFIKQQGEWAFVAQDKSVLDELPGDPLELLGGLQEQYDLAVSANIQNVPQSMRDMAGFLIKSGMEQNLQNSDPDDEQAQLKQQLARKQVDQLIESINDLDKITLGVSIDAENHHSIFDIGVSGVPGSDLARQLSESTADGGASKVAGFLLPGSLLSLHLNSAVSKRDLEQTEAGLASLRTQIMQQIESDEDLEDAQAKAKVKQLVGKTLDILEKTLKKGQVNLGASVVGEGPLTIVAGVLVADAPELEKVVKEFIKLAGDDPNVPKAKLNAAEYKGIKFHTVSLPLSNDTSNVEKIGELFGDPLDVALGFGPDRVYLAAGKGGIDTLKKAIDRSATAPATGLPPMKLSLALAPLMKLAASQQGGNPQAEMLAQQLKQSGKDHVNVTVEPLDNGVRYRIEAEEGINKLLGAALGTAISGGAGGF
ncbi:MAG TPA: hypothetical protein VFW87_11240 [Pirellulales bacterium]|nr:hypothetical protein [Pirellulales bacterium]